MPGTYAVFPDRGLLYIRFDGYVTLAEAEALFREYAAHPDVRSDMTRLFDLEGVTGWDVDYQRLLAIHAENAHRVTEVEGERFMVVYAPTPTSHALGQLIVAPWDGVAGMVVSVQPDQAATLAILGLREDTFDDLLRTRAR